MALRRVLVATYGEGARRIMHACRDENIEPVLLTTTPDDARFALHARGTVAVPPNESFDSITPAEVVRLADDAGCDAVHPGFHGRAADAALASAVEAAHLRWVGPPADLIAGLTDPPAAAALMRDFGVPIAEETARPAVDYLDIPVLADPEGEVVHFPEQCCTVSSGSVALIDESPGDQISHVLRMRLAAAAVLATRCLGYVGAGTLRFRVDSDGEFGFVSMSPHLQGGHAIAEEMTGVDSVRWQLRVAAIEPSGLHQDHIRPRGHVIAAGVHAGGHGSGPITTYREPSGQGIRVDSALAVGTHVASPVVPAVRVTVIAPHRAAAVMRLQEALDTLVIEGLPSNLAALRGIVRSAEFWNREVSADVGGEAAEAWLLGERKAVEAGPAEIRPAGARRRP